MLFGAGIAAEFLRNFRKIAVKRHKNLDRFFFGQAFAKANRLQTNLAPQSRLPIFAATLFPLQSTAFLSLIFLLPFPAVDVFAHSELV
jgi:hypothetical protein